MTDWTPHTARAKEWFESLRDSICAEFEAIEREAGSEAAFQYTPWDREEEGNPDPGGGVQGLTTGAGMWLAGAIGLAAGFGYWQIAGLGTLLVLIVLWLLHVLEVKLELADDKLDESRPGAKGGAAARRSLRPKADDPSRVEPDAGP